MSIPTSATGGAGSYPGDVLGTLLFGINRAIDGAASAYVARENRRADEAARELQYVNAYGDEEAVGAPESKSFAAALQNPWVLAAGAVAVGLLVFLAMKD